ncbi:MAG: hypothetical protein ACPG31_06525 [Planctomycetota bacterium]
MFAAILLLSLALPQQQGEEDAAQVRALFAAKCLECHHPLSDSRKGKREFDRAYDLRAVADHWGDPITPDLALLYEVAEARSMPPKDSDVPRMTAEESELLLRWTLAGCPMPSDGNPFVDLAMASLYLQPQDSEDPPPPPPTPPTFFERISLLFGRLHSPLVHFPVTLLFLAALLRLWRIRSLNDWSLHLERLCLLVGVPSGALAAASGWVNAANTGAGGEELWWHRWIGIGVTSLAAILLLLHKRCGKQLWFTLLLLFLGVALAFGAHKGGGLVFGEDYFRV